MNVKAKKSIHLIYHILVTAMLVVAGLCLMVACMEIYESGLRPFSREAVSKAFSQIAIPVYVCLGLMVCGFLLDGFLPCEKKRRPVEKQYPVILERLQKKLDLDNCSQKNAILALRTSRGIHRSVTLALLGLGSLIFLWYSTDPSHFHSSEVTESMEKAMYILLPCMALPGGYGIFAAYREKKSLEAEIALTREAIAEGATREPDQSQLNCQAAEERTRILRLCIFCVALGLMVYGLFSGGTAEVLTKAVNICTECVGLG